MKIAFFCCIYSILIFNDSPGLQTFMTPENFSSSATATYGIAELGRF